MEHTSNLQRYILTVLAFAAISEVPYDLAMFGQVWNWSEQNSLWTAFIALVMLWLMKNFRGKGMVPTVLGTVFAAGAASGPSCICSGNAKGPAMDWGHWSA